ncbi:Thioredoxin domain-containing protein 5, partial [Lobulomyces angularis]
MKFLQFFLFLSLSLFVFSQISETRNSEDPKTTNEKKKLTREEMLELASKLDKELFHLSHEDFAKKRLIPKWHKLQKKVFENLSSEYKFKVAKVDCTQDEEFCGKYGVDAYPTIILYNNGKPVEEYSSEQDVSSMYQYSKAMA